MYYQNFDDNITAKFGVIVKSWPLAKFCSPNDIGSRVELNILHNAWQSGTAHFYKMSDVEFNSWTNTRYQQPENAREDATNAPAADLNPPTADAIPTPAANTPAAPTNLDAPATNTPATNTLATNTLATNTPTSNPAPSAGPLSALPLSRFINATTVTGPDGTAIQVTKKARKVRSDKGVKKGSHRGTVLTAINVAPSANMDTVPARAATPSAASTSAAR
jgi:hypothetical protein